MTTPQLRDGEVDSSPSDDGEPQQLTKPHLDSSTCRLELPSGAKIWPEFHVSLLKRAVKLGRQQSQTLPNVDEAGEYILTPHVKGKRSKLNRRGREIHSFLVEWSNNGAKLDTWVTEDYLKKTFPDLQPWGQGSLEGRGTATGRHTGKYENGGGNGRLEVEDDLMMVMIFVGEKLDCVTEVKDEDFSDAKDEFETVDVEGG